MSVELVPSIQCNLSCPYCYQNPMRDAGNFGENSRSYDMEKMKEGLAREGGNFTLFGGEALMMPVADIEELFKFGLEKYGQNGIQSNGVLITPELIELFVEYKVGVGISADGPGPMNDSRWAGSLEKTRAATDKTMANIEALVAAGVVPSLIITLHRGNALPPEREKLKEWFRWLDGLGIKSARLHILEVDHPEVAEHMALTDEENAEAFLDLCDFEGTLSVLRFETFKDMTRLLTGDDSRTVCLWNACDPKTTAAVRGVDGQGHGSNCGRTNKDGVMMLKTEERGYERQVALYSTPQSANGCEGCRFFIMCKGECPGTAVDGDWRNRTRDCETWKTLFAHIEQRLIAEGTVPLSMMSDKLERLETIMLDRWSRGENIQIHSALEILDGGAPDPVQATRQADAHGDAHGDSDVSPVWTHSDAGVQYAGDTEYVPRDGGPHGDSGGRAGHADHEDAVNTFHGDEPHGDCAGGRP